MDQAETLREQGFALHQAGRLVEAERLYRQSLAQDAEDPTTCYMLGVLCLQQGRAAEALTLLGKALDEEPDDPELLGHHGLALHELKRFDEALKDFDKALGHDSGFALGHFYRGNTLRAMDRHEEALVAYEKLRALTPGFAGGWYGRGVSLAQLGRTAEALSACDQAVKLEPTHGQAWYQRGDLLQKMKKLPEALASYDQAVRLLPNFAGGWTNRASVLLGLKRWRDALDSADRALVLGANAAAWSNRSMALAQLNDRRGALESIERALALEPDLADALCNLSSILCGKRDYEGALTAADRAIAIQPRHADAWHNRGAALQGLHRYGEGLATYEKALELNPAHAAALVGAAGLANQVCDFARRARYAPMIDKMVREDGIVAPFTFLAYPADDMLRRRCAENYQRHSIPERPPPLWTGQHYRHDRIRIAYLSADFHQHATAHLMAGLFEHHDRARFEVSAWSFGQDEESPMRTRLRNAFEHFHEVRDKSDTEVARLLREAEIDIAIDLKGPTREARLGIFAARPTPVQAQYLGYPGTVGVDFIDYIIADAIVAPFESQAGFTEKIVHLPHSYQVNDDKRPIAPNPPSRAQAGLGDGFVFCAFNGAWKITPEFFAIWMRLLAAVPGSQLWLIQDNPSATANLRREAAARDIDPSRLVFAPHMGHDEHLARHALADLFLDNLPCNAHTTASDALWAGLPVITCRGDSFSGRVAASLLTAIGLPELVTENAADYEALALELARNPERLRAIRTTLAANRRTEPLFDTGRFTRAIETVYVRMTEIAQAGEPPQSFAVQ